MRVWPRKLTKSPPRPAAFLDRDGTLTRNRAGVYVTRPEQLKLYARTPAALRMLAAKGYRLVVVTNQSGVARGYMSLETAKKINYKLVRDLRREGVKLDSVYLCPHGPSDKCGCRKPAPGLINEAASDRPVDMKRSFVAGDKECDLLLARRAGIRGCLVLTGQGKAAEARRGYRDLLALARTLPDVDANGKERP